MPFENRRLLFSTYLNQYRFCYFYDRAGQFAFQTWIPLKTVFLGVICFFWVFDSAGLFIYYYYYYYYYYVSAGGFCPVRVCRPAVKQVSGGWGNVWFFVYGFSAIQLQFFFCSILSSNVPGLSLSKIYFCSLSNCFYVFFRLWSR